MICITSRYVRLLLLTTLLAVFGVASFNYCIDPLHYYHIPRERYGYNTNQRLQYPGLVKNFNYNTILLGTSRTEIIHNSSLSQLMGDQALNLSMEGSTITEQSLLAALAISTGKAKRVLWEMNYPLSFFMGDSFEDDYEYFPEYLYEPGIETLFRYLISWTTFTDALKALNGNRPQDLDSMHDWENQYEFSESRVMEAFSANIKYWNPEFRKSCVKRMLTPVQLNDLFAKSVLALVQANPQVQFDLFLPPNTYLMYALDLHIAFNRFKNRLALRETIVDALSRFSNIRVFDFQTDEQLTNELNRYKDLDHFDSHILTQILSDISHGKRVVTAKEIRKSNSEFYNLALFYITDFCNNQPQLCTKSLTENLNLLLDSQ